MVLLGLRCAMVFASCGCYGVARWLLGLPVLLGVLLWCSYGVAIVVARCC